MIEVAIITRMVITDPVINYIWDVNFVKKKIKVDELVIFKDL